MQNDGIRDRKRRETKRRIIDEAVRLVQESGFDAVTVEDICAAAGISRRTFFNYMDSKDEAVLGVFPFVFSADSLERIRTTPSENILELIIASVDTVEESYGPTPDIRHALLEANPGLFHAEAARKHHMLIELGGALNDHFERFPRDRRTRGPAETETHIALGIFRTALSRYLWSPACSGCEDPVEGLRRTTQEITTYAQELKW